MLLLSRVLGFCPLASSYLSLLLVHSLIDIFGNRALFCSGGVQADIYVPLSEICQIMPLTEEFLI